MLPSCARLQRWQIGWLQRKCKVSKQIQFFEKNCRQKHNLWKVSKHFQFLWTRVMIVIDFLFILKVCKQFQFSWTNHDNQTRTIQEEIQGKYRIMIMIYTYTGCRLPSSPSENNPAICKIQSKFCSYFQRLIFMQFDIVMCNLI